MTSHLRFDLGEGEERNWVISETSFSEFALGKCESIMAQGNGYLGLRAATEERYSSEHRDLFIAGTYSRLPGEVPELPNAADPIGMELIVNGEAFHLLSGTTREYRRNLDLRTGELVRRVVWNSTKGDEVEFTFRRFVSLKNLHLVGQSISIRPLNSTIRFRLISGINGRMSNSGSQHFIDGEKRSIRKRVLQLVQTTQGSGITFVHTTMHSFDLNDNPVDPAIRIAIERRRIHGSYTLDVPQGQTLTVKKISHICTGYDPEFCGRDAREIQEIALERLLAASAEGYEALFQQSAQAWRESVWQRYRLELECENAFDLVALRFAIYHLVVMTPAHDDRASVGAKGLSGEAYKGHVFWDTELYILPFFSLSNAAIARSLLQYRCRSIWAARDKAEKKGYRGLMFPWESAVPGEGETTPDYGPADVVTGRATRLWMADHEIHLMGAIAYAIWHYYQVTHDDGFMEAGGSQILFELADFWQSRMQLNSMDGLYHINDVMGPNEFKGHINDNAYTNYLALWTIQKALRWSEQLELKNPIVYARFNRKLELDTLKQEWREKSARLFLPRPRPGDSLIPEESRYLEKKEIDLTPYRDDRELLLHDYNLDQLNDIQVTKQADLILLFYLLSDQFSTAVKEANWRFYTTRTLHLSSLSAAVHSIVANDIGRADEAYEFFRRAAEVDLGPDKHSSDEGIHAGAQGALWQAAINGFAGVRIIEEGLSIAPRLPKSWRSLAFSIVWKRQRLDIRIDHNELRIRKPAGASLELKVYGRIHLLDETLTVSLQDETAAGISGAVGY